MSQIRIIIAALTVVSLGGCAVATDRAAPLGVTEQALSTFVAYHGLTAAQHQARVDALSPDGYRPVALNVSGDPTDARYAAVWVRRPGPDWHALHGFGPEDFQTHLEALQQQGYAPRTLSATGERGREIFAAVFEQAVDREWSCRFGLRWNADPSSADYSESINYANAVAFDRRMIPISLAVYGAPNDRRFAGIWVENREAVAWSWWVTENAAYQRFFDALVASGARPSVLSVAPDGMILSVFRDDRIGPWEARHGRSPQGYQEDFDAQLAQGRRPIVVAAGGDRYAAVFAEDEIPIARTLRVTGAGFAHDAELDDAVSAFMVDQGIRAGTVAIGRGGVVRVARGYTVAEPGVPTTQPDTRFRLASLSKIFAAAEASALVANGRLAWDARAFASAGVSAALPPGTSSDPALAATTVDQLLLRTSGLRRDFPSQRDVAALLGAGVPPVPRADLLGYLYGLPIAGPGYSNTAFYLLTTIDERAAGLPFMAALDRDVLGPLGIHDVSVARTAVDARQPGEVNGYDAPTVGLSELDFAPDALAPAAYGGEFVLETGEGAGGLLSSAGSVVRLIAHYPIWNGTAAQLQGRELATRYGRFAGTATGASSRADGLDFAFLFNRALPPAEQDRITTAIHAELDRWGAAL